MRHTRHRLPGRVFLGPHYAVAGLEHGELVDVLPIFDPWYFQTFRECSRARLYLVSPVQRISPLSTAENPFVSLSPRRHGAGPTPAVAGGGTVSSAAAATAHARGNVRYANITVSYCSGVGELRGCGAHVWVTLEPAIPPLGGRTLLNTLASQAA